ncbi:electron transport complex subunit RsxG [Halomonas sp. PA5]|nr:electron transport complex subunit RsxG [Halomonas sp. PA5]
MARAMLRGTLGLALFAVVTAVVVAGTRALTEKRIADNYHAAQYRLLGEMLPVELQDVSVTALLDNTLTLPPTRALGQREPFTAWRVRRGEHAALIVPVIAHGGYSGDIDMLLGIDQSGRLSAVRVVRHQETPGLGDKIERRKSDWITSFDGRSLDNPTLAEWSLARDGGEFDGFTGATITPQAVIMAVRHSLQWFAFDGHRLLREEAESDS